jgi:hypothetical protein
VWRRRRGPAQARPQPIEIRARADPAQCEQTAGAWKREENLPFFQSRRAVERGDIAGAIERAVVADHRIHFLQVGV